MKINEVIKKYRKEQGLTQEQMANYLGVTAPAVNKWENGISYPDITLLSPIARLLKIDVDTLLSFREELSDNEIGLFVNEIAKSLNSEEYINSNEYEKVFNIASSKIREYPRCEKLMLSTAQVLNGFLVMINDNMDDIKKYKNQINKWLEESTKSSDSSISNIAFITLSQNYMNDEEYEKAQELLDKIPPRGFDKRITQANLYIKQEKYDEAYRIHETMIFQDINAVIGSLMHITTLLCIEKDYKRAIKYSEIAERVADDFGLGKFIGLTAKLDVYLKLKDEEKSLNILKVMADSIESYGDFVYSGLYRHMEFKKNEDKSQIKLMIKRSLEADKETDFLKENPRYKELMSKF